MFSIFFLFLFFISSFNVLFCYIKKNRLETSLFYCVNKDKSKSLNKYLLGSKSILELKISISNFIENNIVVFGY